MVFQMPFESDDADSQWIFTADELLDTPSIADGITPEQERMDRTKGCHYILAVAAKLNLPVIVSSTATTLFHRFYMRQSMKRFHVYDMAATCLYLATKVEESARRMKDLVTACAQKAQKNDKLQLDENSKDFIKWQDTVLCNELILLETVCFDMTIDHPQAYLCELEAHNISPLCLRRAWMLLYQSMGAPFSLMYRGNVLAAAALVLAAQYTDEEVPISEVCEILDVDYGLAHELAADMLGYQADHYLKRSHSGTPNPHAANTPNPYAGTPNPHAY